MDDFGDTKGIELCHADAPLVGFKRINFFVEAFLES
jgi:hypothetical protein